MQVRILQANLLRLLYRRVLRVRVPLIARVNDLAVGARSMAATVVRVISCAALAVERALLVGVARTSVHGARIVLVLTLLSMEALEVRILARAHLVFLRFGQHCFFRSFLRVHVGVLLALLQFIRGKRLVVALVLRHEVVILLYLLLVAHDLIQLHLAV